ncbi:MAG: helix-turn-helix domain-containing protein [Acidobacterium ailaaui]|nr:helix-turn-helix domain-containing protein [Pseudacidobacterium ailaaui]MDI3253187.1 helix-turn-helix domain-containing protein [Bacillota bacterium]
MGQFGEDLRKERESRGITLESITDATKISSRHLLALEEGQFDLLPGGVFNKGIVRNYARAVGLDENVWVERFLSAYRESGHLKDEDVNWIEFAENVSKTRHVETVRSGQRLRWTGVVVLLVLLSVLGWFVWRYVSGRIATANLRQVHSMTTSAAMLLTPQRGQPS